MCSLLGLDLLVGQVEGHGDLAEKWEMAILRCESVPEKLWHRGSFTFPPGQSIHSENKKPLAKSPSHMKGVK